MYCIAQQLLYIMVSLSIVGYFAFACIQNMTMGGIIFGWNSICSLLSDSNNGPGLSSDFIQSLFVAATFSHSFGPLFLGYILDRFGPRMCSALSIFLITLGCLSIIIYDYPHYSFFVIGICLIGFGGAGIQSSLIHLSNLFPSWKSSATAIITGSFQLSFLVFYIFDYLWRFKNWNYKDIFKLYMMVCCTNFIVSVAIWPDTPITYKSESNELDENIKIGILRVPSVFIHHTEEKDIADERTGSMQRIKSSLWTIPDDELQYNDEISLYEYEELDSIMINDVPHKSIHFHNTLDIKQQSFRGQLFSFVFMELSVYFIISALLITFYIGTLDIQLGDSQLLTTDERSSYDKHCTTAMALGALAIPIVGVSMDYFGFPATSLLATIFAIIWSILLLIGTKSSILISFLFYSLFRTFLITFTFAYVADAFGFHYYGVLVGVLFVINGFVGLLQYPLKLLVSGTCHLQDNERLVQGTFECTHGFWKQNNVFMLFFFVFSLLFSYRDYLRRKKIAKATASNTSLSKLDIDNRLNSKTTLLTTSSGISKYMK